MANMDECVFAGPLSRLVSSRPRPRPHPRCQCKWQKLIEQFRERVPAGSMQPHGIYAIRYMPYVFAFPSSECASLALFLSRPPLSQLLNPCQASFFTILCALDSIVLAQYLFDFCYQNALCDYRKNA